MVRDHNGYTPLLKAASCGNLHMVKTLIEDAGVDPFHVDPYGNNALDKARLYNRYEIIAYLKDANRKALEGDIKIIDWNKRGFRRSGKYRTSIDYWYLIINH